MLKQAAAWLPETEDVGLGSNSRAVFVFLATAVIVVEEANTRERRETPQTKEGRCTTADPSRLPWPHLPGNGDPSVSHAPHTTHSGSE